MVQIGDGGHGDVDTTLLGHGVRIGKRSEEEGGCEIR